MFQTSVITSGSKGNCILVKNNDTHILIDAGISFKKFSEFMTELQLDPLKIDAIFISHEHTDHVCGAGVLHRKIKAPIFITPDTYNCATKKIGKIHFEPHFFDIGSSLQIGSLIVNPFLSSHDAVDSCNFVIHPFDNDNKQLTIATDLGFAHNLLKNYLKQSSTIILESNHDVDMLMNGPYEWHLKQRILSKLGHLSNIQASEIVENIITDSLKRIFLAHLSEINNTPQIAYKQMENTLSYLQAKTDLKLTSQYQCTPLYEI
ncbi:MAG: MBL fold metallo-hydrolase [Candidatus Cloacimonetes bacterium]|nr:MBL fold metallo-hydrolase [Candidatus Cloacimonadota bacterium]